MEKMQEHLSDVDMNKLKIIFEVKEAYNNGKISLEEGRARLKKEVGSIKPYEIALAEQELKEFNDDECEKEDIQKMLELFDEIMDTSDLNLDKNHPISCYLQENEEMKKLLLSVEDLVQYPVIKNQWLELYEKLEAFKIHLSRKQNQLYSILEQKGFDRPTTTMWTLDNFVRDEISEAHDLLKADKDDDFVAMQNTLVADVRDLMQKEETVLYPTSLAMINDKEFEDMKSGDREIGFAWITVSEHNAKNESKSNEVTEPPKATQNLTEDLVALLTKHGLQTSTDTTFDVATGKLSLEQINLIYRHLPVDISYVDEKDIVCFYSDTDHRVFPRSKNVIGRNVKNCHPRASVHIVEEIIEKFRSGEQNSAEFWINKPDLFIYIYYVAVRDEKGAFRGVLEMMQDCTHIRSLKDSRTLLNWDNENEQTAETLADKNETAPKTEHTKENTKDKTINITDITAETKLSNLLQAYPYLKDELPKINKKFSLLHTPLARIMIPKATVAIMSERTGMNIDELIIKIKETIKNNGGLL